MLTSRLCVHLSIRELDRRPPVGVGSTKSLEALEAYTYTNSPSTATLVHFLLETLDLFLDLSDLGQFDLSLVMFLMLEHVMLECPSVEAAEGVLAVLALPAVILESPS